MAADFSGIEKESEERKIEKRLAALGVWSPAELAELARAKKQWLIEDLLFEPSINLLVGDSGVGKTALALQLAICLAGGTAFLGRDIDRKHRVLYCDAESDPTSLTGIIANLSEFLDADQENVQKNLKVMQPYVLKEQRTSLMNLAAAVETVANIWKPSLVVVDTMRIFWPLSIEKQSEAVRMIGRMRRLSRDNGCSWLLIHHVRKASRSDKIAKATLEDGVTWFQEAAGSHAVVNSTDTRIGVEATKKENDKGVVRWAGFTRLTGPFGPSFLRRVKDGKRVLGYQAIAEDDIKFDSMGEDQRDVLEKLPEVFTTVEVISNSEGKKVSRATVFRWLNEWTSAGVVKKVGRAKYEKTGVNKQEMN